MFPSVTLPLVTKNQNRNFLQSITENSFTLKTPRSMYNALKIKFILNALKILGSLASDGSEIKNEIYKMFFLFLSVTLYTFVSIDRSNIFISLLFCSLSTISYLCYDNDNIVKDGAGQEIQTIEFSELSDFPLRNNPNTVI